MITGTGPVAFAGVTSVTCMFTLISGSRNYRHARQAILVMIVPLLVVLVTSQFTVGVFFGVRP